MATNASDNLDEFFDFSALDHDNGFPQSKGVQNDMFSMPDDVTIMDWAVNAPSTVYLTDNIQPLDLHMYDSSQDFFNEPPLQQWPLVGNDNGQSTIRGDNNDSSTRQANSPACIKYPQPIHIDTARPDASPSSSLLKEEFDVIGMDDNKGSADTSCLAHLSSAHSNVPSSKHLPIRPVSPSFSRSRPSAKPRAGSVASWKPASAKRKGPQSRIPLEAKQILEDEFAANPYPCSWELDIIAHQANLDVKKVRNWFNNTRARKKGEDDQTAPSGAHTDTVHSLNTKLSKDSLEALDKHADDATQQPQPPLTVYLAQSYQEEAVELSAVQAAIDEGSLSGSAESQDIVWSDSKNGRRASLVTSVTSSENTAPTAYTVSSSGSRSKTSSFGRDRRRGRRRMAWKDSPRQNINGVNSAGEPQKDLPFFCTFCPRAFKTKYEWIRHEDSVHALRTTWICCDAKSSVLQACPFCGQAHPDDAHMAAHKYQQCRSKPESQRTFYRRDHFVQHLHHVHFANAKHPSVRVGCQARLLAADGHNFGCKDLAMKWRRFGAPMKLDDPMLGCGFCGKKSKDWAARCEHVAEHLIARDLDRAVWWGERKENHLENLYSSSPYESFRCRYCLKVFTDVKEMNKHSHCRVWSCRFLKSFDDVAADNAGQPLYPDLPSAKAHHCYLCGSGYRTFHVEHAQNQHRYRSCNQEFYTSEEAFLQHLHNFHGASQPAVLRGSSVIEQSFMRNKGASFEPVEFNESWQPCVMDLDVASVSPFIPDNTVSALCASQKKIETHVKKQPSIQKKSRDGAQSRNKAAQQAQRLRSDTTASRFETHGPRFFRLSTYIPFISSRIFYARSAKTEGLPREDQAVLEEMPKPAVASLVMSAGLVSMATVRWPIKPDAHAASGMVELTMGDEEN